MASVEVRTGAIASRDPDWPARRRHQRLRRIGSSAQPTSLAPTRTLATRLSPVTTTDDATPLAPRRATPVLFFFSSLPRILNRPPLGSVSTAIVMERPSTDDAAAAPALPPAAIEAITAPRPPDAPRRCFICLSDEDPSDPPGSWVDPCPCTLEAHQDCMLSWVTDCERSNKPLQCPVCKSMIELEGPWNLVVAAADAVHRRFTRASPLVLFTGVSMGVQLSLQMYGAMALWTFAGKDTLLRFMLGADMVIDGRSAGNMRFLKERIWNVLLMMNVGPTLLFGRLLPGLSNKIFLPAASLYGMYHVMHEDDFLTWPPSPQLAMAVFPYVRSIYYNLWKEFILPYEVKLNRQLVGLPPAEERPNDGQQGANNQRHAQRNGNADGGIIGLLQGILDALDPDGDDGQAGGNDVNRIEFVHDDVEVLDGGEAGEIMVELQIEEVELDENGAPVAGGQPIEPPRPLDQPGDDAGGPDGAAPAADEAQAAQPNDDQDQPGHEAPQAPPRRMGIGTILSNVSNAIVSTLILPGISFAMGEALRLALPKAWTVAAPRNPWARYGVVGRPGLLQQQWGRSLVGGCLYIVLKDAVRVYTKSRRVAAMGNRRVKNVDRRRRDK
ncbi:E3 ubiquitin-protein ligase MARCH5 [Tolypocladium paradoxum]|uniref:E3 ubiquitin-protein ligase MARCH5 n=1 Tax=Tolypocladium paradoxum TaxID=94208 RepID=A0A2S4L919_9HYPO|nr:E3 ubiquitin-protein ligase MARCH5 [Tolypocladium paradoxum]